MKVLRRSVLLVLAAALAAAAVDVGVRLRVVEDGRYKGRELPPFGRLDESAKENLRRILEKPGIEEPHVFNGFDLELGWSNFPGRTKKDGDEITINSIGARSTREYAPVPPEGTLRVVCYGESFTFGSEVGDADCWPARLEALDPAIEAINMGVGGYGTDQALLRFRREGAFGGHVLMVGVLLENIARNVNRCRTLFVPKTQILVVKPRFTLEESGELSLVPLPFGSRREVVQAALDGTLLERLEPHEYWAGDEPLVPGSALVRILAARKAYERRSVRRLWLDVDGEPFRVMLAVLEAFRNEARAAGVEEFLVLVFPTQQDLRVFGRARGREPYWATFHRALDESGIAYLDLAPELSAREGPLFGESHLTPQGNQIVAEAVRRWLDSRL